MYIGLTRSLSPLAGAAVDPTAIGAMGGSAAAMAQGLPALSGASLMLSIDKVSHSDLSYFYSNGNRFVADGRCEYHRWMNKTVARKTAYGC